MTSKQIAASLASVVVISAVVFGVASRQSAVAQFTRTPITATQLTNQKSYDGGVKISGTMLGVLDGGKVYFVSVRFPDGGIQRKIVPPTHVRRNPTIGSNCRARLPDGGTRDPGDYNRFPIAQAVGTDCQTVSEVVYLGQDAQSNQDVSRKR